MKNNTFDIKNKIYLIILFILLAVFSVLLVKISNDENTENIKDFIQNDIKVLYVSDEHNYSNYPIKLFKKYEIQYMYLDITNLTKFEQVSIEKIIKTKNLKKTIAIFNNGDLVDILIDYEDENSLNKFLQDHNIIPEVIGKNEGIIEDVKNLVDTDFTMIYIPYKYIDGMQDQDNILNDIAIEHNFNYKRIDAYLLSYVQQQKLNSILQISTVEDQIIILIKDKKIIGSIRGFEEKKDVIERLYEFNFISEKENSLNEIDYNDFKILLESNSKNVILISKNDCKFCDDVIKKLNSIMLNYNIEINYINISDFDDEIIFKIEKRLKDIGYTEGFTTPITLIIENNKILDYIIGTSTEEYLVDIFKENGIIK